MTWPHSQEYIKGGGDINARHEGTLWSPLHTACYKGQYTVVEALVSAGAKFDKQVEGRYNPLLLCCSCGSKRMLCPVSYHDAADVEDPGSASMCGHIKVNITFRTDTRCSAPKQCVPGCVIHQTPDGSHPIY